MIIYVDGDSCHVLHLAEKIAKKFHLECHVFCDTNHMINPFYAEVHYVEKGPNSADFAIIKRVEKGDVVVTNDSGLASMVLSKKGIPINSRGFVFDHSNISTFLNSRHMRSFAKKKTGRNQVKGLLSDELIKNKEKPNFYGNLTSIVERHLHSEENNKDL